MTAQVLNLIPATRVTVGTIKTTIGQAALALESGALTIAIRDNGPKINATLVAIDGDLGDQCKTYFARKAGGGAYGVHTVLGVMKYDVIDGEVAVVDLDCLIDIDLETKIPVFMVESISDLDEPVVAEVTEVEANEGALAAEMLEDADLPEELAVA